MVALFLPVIVKDLVWTQFPQSTLLCFSDWLFYLLSRGVSMQSRLAWNLCSFCLSFLSDGGLPLCPVRFDSLSYSLSPCFHPLPPFPSLSFPQGLSIKPRLDWNPLFSPELQMSSTLPGLGFFFKCYDGIVLFLETEGQDVFVCLFVFWFGFSRQGFSV